jgi:broad specificity polyphosphatase/5'/3'-nucleotidase SurE
VDTDIYAINNKYISITPINVDLTDYELKNRMHDWNLNW